jgi:GTPase SAR1 family protein
LKIAGTFFEAKLVLDKSSTSAVEFQILKDGQIQHRVNLNDFDTLRMELEDFFGQHKIVIPKPRLNKLVQDLEGKFMDLTQNQERNNSINIAKHKSSTQAYEESVKNRKDTQKIIIMGLENAGKTSIYQVIFEGKLPHETHTLAPTRGVERHNILFPEIDAPKDVIRPSGQRMAIWDLGGQKSFLARYDQEPELYFGEASCLLYILDAYNVDRFDEARKQLHTAIENFSKYGTHITKNVNLKGKVFCLVHKMDHFPNREEKFNSLVSFLRENPENRIMNFDITFLPTTIFDSSIYSAWTKVIQTIMPKSSKLNLYAQNLKDDLNLYACIIIEKRTGLPISASKTLLDDAALVGSSNRVLITLEKVLPEFQLAGIQEFTVKTSSGTLDVRIFDKYYLLVLLYPPSVDMNEPENKAKLSKFIRDMTKII